MVRTSTIEAGVVRHGDSLSTALGRVGLGAAAVDEIVRALAGSFDARLVKKGQSFEVVKAPEGALEWLRFEVGPGEAFQLFRASDRSLRCVREPAARTAELSFVEGTIDDSLYAAMDAAGETPALTMAFVELFAWDIDFFTETQDGDRFRVIVEKRRADGVDLGYGNVLAAEYRMSLSNKVHRAFWFLGKGGGGYYAEDGTSVKKAFLKSPVKFSSITSRYGLRRHPILEYVRAHRGVDYGAPMGTAIWAMGDGIVDFAGVRGGYGNVVILRHTNGFESRYAHLNGFGRGIKRGIRVSQKQVIGYLGRSGLATGPHLHFEVLKNGRYINPMQVSVPPAPPISPEERPAFLEAVRPFVRALDEGRLVVATSSTATSAAAGP
ncbi:MAG: M23 family metallopeptidase [Deltaproteobacteria bacterium]|nr:M23 family metallopeptidase [Deltaproteobacteria bacterium]